MNNTTTLYDVTLTISSDDDLTPHEVRIKRGRLVSILTEAIGNMASFGTQGMHTLTDHEGGLVVEFSERPSFEVADQVLTSWWDYDGDTNNVTLLWPGFDASVDRPNDDLWRMVEMLDSVNDMEEAE